MYSEYYMEHGREMNYFMCLILWINELVVHGNLEQFRWMKDIQDFLQYGQPDNIIQYVAKCDNKNNVLHNKRTLGSIMGGFYPI